nr:MAG: hypothetical protein DIU78_01975 [Pseudomonadota bacterium]
MVTYDMSTNILGYQYGFSAVRVFSRKRDVLTHDPFGRRNGPPSGTFGGRVLSTLQSRFGTDRGNESSRRDETGAPSRLADWLLTGATDEARSASRHVETRCLGSGSLRRRNRRRTGPVRGTTE